MNKTKIKSCCIFSKTQKHRYNKARYLDLDKEFLVLTCYASPAKFETWEEDTPL